MNNSLKLFLLLTLASILVSSCGKTSDLSKDFDCSNGVHDNIEIVSDFQNNFSLPIPKNWKVNLYYDNAQSSIYFADTTKQLTETTIIDITFIKQKTSFNGTFLKNVQTNYTSNNLVEETKKTFLLKELPSYYTIAKGVKNKFPYAICNVFINTNTDKFVHAKLEVYGDSLVNERLCRGINLIEKINFK
jgi:hypothetical protein